MTSTTRLAMRGVKMTSEGVHSSIFLTPDIADDPWTHLTPGNLPYNTGGMSATLLGIGIIRAGTINGKASVAFDIQLPDGTHVFTETTLKLFRQVALAALATPIAIEEE